MSERDELARMLFVADNHGQPEKDSLDDWAAWTESGKDSYTHRLADAILAAGYRKPRTIKGAAELEALPFGSGVQTSDEADVVVLRCEGRNFRNQSGYELSVETLWRYGTQPFTVLYEPTA